MAGVACGLVTRQDSDTGDILDYTILTDIAVSSLSLSLSLALYTPIAMALMILHSLAYIPVCMFIL